MHLQADIRGLPRKLSNGGADSRLRIARCFIEHRYFQFPAHALVDVINAVAKNLHPAEQAQGFLVDALAFSRQRKASSPTTAQNQPKAGFKILDMPADSRSANVQFEFGR